MQVSEPMEESDRTMGRKKAFNKLSKTALSRKK